MTVSLEVVPRDRENLILGAALAAEFPRIGMINAPDLLRFPLRSWDACGVLGEEFRRRETAGGRAAPLLVPHLRAIDFDPERPFPLREFFRSRGIGRVLVIAGDPPPEGTGRRVWPGETPAFIKKLRAEMPELEVYAAFDPYRSNIRYELEYLACKEAAGASGFMSQPFFDLRLLEIYAEYLEGKEVYWGIAPVLSPSSRRYWESRNRAVFPRSFRADLDWNTGFGREVLRFCEERSFSLYLMPIKTDARAYLAGIFR
jgi:methylenetetrahydrofolate reductase (NADPH)